MDISTFTRHLGLAAAIIGMAAVFTGAQEKTPEAKAESAPSIELTEPRVEPNADGTFADGWNATRLARADGLIYSDQRMTVREFIEAVGADTLNGHPLTIVVSPAIRFKRLQGVAQAVTNAKLGVAEIRWSTADQSQLTFPLVFASNPFNNIRIENGQVLIGSGVLGEVGEDFVELLADLTKRREEQAKTRVALGLTLVNKKKSTQMDWRLSNKKIDRKDALVQMKAALVAKKKNEGKATLAFAPDHLIRCGDIQAVFAAAKQAGAEATEITNGSDTASFSKAFGWNTRDPSWLPRAIDNALKALFRSQSPRGGWQTTRNGDIGNIGATSLALLAFLGEFHTPEEGKYKDAVASGLQFLLSKQKQDGSLVGEISGFSFDHVLGTYALIETYGQTGDDAHAEAARSAFRFLMRCRGKQGAWGKSGPSDTPDLVVTAWAATALKSADDCGLDVPEEAWTKLGKWVESLTDAKTAKIKSRQGDKRITTLVGVADEFFGRHHESLRSLALLIRARCDQDIESNKALALGVTGLQTAPPDSESVFGLPDLDYLYFGAMVMNAFGNPAWQPWRHGLNSCVESHFKKVGGNETREVRRMMNADATELSLLSLCLQLSYRYAQTHEDD
jgi:hypothetical protein